MRAFCINLCLLAVVVCAWAFHDGHKHENEHGLRNGGDHDKHLMDDGGVNVGLHDNNHGRKRRSPQVPEANLPEGRKRRSEEPLDDKAFNENDECGNGDENCEDGGGEVEQAPEEEEDVELKEATRKRRSSQEETAKLSEGRKRRSPELIDDKAPVEEDKVEEIEEAGLETEGGVEEPKEATRKRRSDHGNNNSH